MLPLRDEIPTKRVPRITIIIILLNCLVYFYQFFMIKDLHYFVYSYGLIPYEITKGVSLVPSVSTPIQLTVFSSMFMHGSLVHLAGNMLYLWIFGNNVEDFLGKLRFIIFYVLSGIFAALGQIIVSPNSTVPMIGSSGAIAGVLGAYLILFPRARITTLVFFGFFIMFTFAWLVCVRVAVSRPSCVLWIIFVKVVFVF